MLVAVEQLLALRGHPERAVIVDIGIQVAERDQLAKQAAPFILIEVADSEGAELIVPVLQDAVPGVTHQNVDDVVDAETLTGSIDAGKRHLCGLSGVPGLRWFDAVVAVPAGLGQDFVEVGEQGLSSAASLFAKAEHRFHLLLQDALELLVGVALRHHLP